MTRSILVVALCAYGGCATAAPGGMGDAAVDASAPLDAPEPVDESVDAAPDVRDLFCTGYPVPDGLACLVQDPAAVGPCAGHGAVAFDGTQCRAARGAACGVAGRGGFDSFEESGVTCARAGYCFGPGVWSLPSDGATVPDGCPDAPAERRTMSLADARGLPPGCTTWGPFSDPSPYPTSAELPYPEQWDVLWSLSLIADLIEHVNCVQR